MKINLYYNEFNKDYNLNILKKIGFIQEEILSLNNLLIYNIEDIKIKINNNYYILGIDDLYFNLNLKYFLEKNNLNESDIEKIVIYDRKRDENGNVIKDNIIIDKYNEWYANNNYSNFEHNNSHILRFPIDMILHNILRRIPLNNSINISNNNISYDPLNIITDKDADDKDADERDDDERDGDERDDDERDGDERDAYERDDDDKDAYERDADERDADDKDADERDADDKDADERDDDERDHDERDDDEKNDDERRDADDKVSNINNNSIENLNDIINIFDNIIHRNTITNIRNDYNSLYNRYSNLEYLSLSPILENLQNEYDDMPDLIDNNNNIFNFMNIDQNYEDVKVILNEEQFANQKHSIFKELNNNTTNECLICIQEFDEDDEVTKITCNHVFHKNCIKNWVCKESNKCPICRLEVDKFTC